VILTSGPTGYDELTRLLTDIHGVEGWAAGSSSGLASAVRTELYALRHRLWALHLLGGERSFTAPLSLTETGIAATLSALLARALRPRHHPGVAAAAQQGRQRRPHRQRGARDEHHDQALVERSGDELGEELPAGQDRLARGRERVQRVGGGQQVLH